MNDIGLVPLSTTVATSSVDCRVSALMYVSDQDSRFLRKAMDSLFAQTVPVDQLVLVVGGTLTDEQEGILAAYQTDSRIASIDIIRAKSLADGFNTGLALCNGDWILRVDGDTVNHPDRLAILMDYVDQYPNVTVLSSWCEEFGENVRRIKVSSVQHDAVVNALRWRNAVVSPSTLLHSETLRSIGGYRHVALAEYDLHVRLALAGATFRVIPAALISMPVRPRSGGLRELIEEVRFRIFCWRSGFLNKRQFLTITLCQALFDLVGASARNRLYRLVRSYPKHTVTPAYPAYVVTRPNREARSNV